MRILRLPPLRLKKMPLSDNFGFNPIESSCNNSKKHSSKFQKNQTVNKK